MPLSKRSHTDMEASSLLSLSAAVGRLRPSKCCRSSAAVGKQLPLECCRRLAFSQRQSINFKERIAKIICRNKDSGGQVPTAAKKSFLRCRCYEYFEANASTRTRRCGCFHLHHQNENANSFTPYNELAF